MGALKNPPILLFECFIDLLIDWYEELRTAGHDVFQMFKFRNLLFERQEKIQ